MPAVAGDRGDLLASIRGGGKGGLKKVDKTVIRDRSAAAVPGTEAAAPPPPSGGSAAPAGGEAGLAGALAAALSQRKKRVGGSGEFPSYAMCSEVVLTFW